MYYIDIDYSEPNRLPVPENGINVLAICFPKIINIIDYYHNAILVLSMRSGFNVFSGDVVLRFRRFYII